MNSLLLGILVSGLLASIIYGLECGFENEENQEEMRRVAKMCLGDNGDGMNESSTEMPVDEVTNVNEESKEDLIAPRRVGLRYRRSRFDRYDRYGEEESSEFIGESDQSGSIGQNGSTNRKEGVGQNVGKSKNRNDSTGPKHNINRTKNIGQNKDSDKGEEEETNETQTPKTDEEESFNNTNHTAPTCAVQCILSSLEMTNEEGFPEHEKVLINLLKRIDGRELRDFWEDAINECFQSMIQNYKSDPCFHSMHLVACLSDKGKQNCADWPVGNLPFPISV